jgi:hypothetical protein
MIMAEPTHQDAVLMIQLANLMVTSGAQEAKDWLWGDEFIPGYTEFVQKYPPGSDGYLRASTVCGYFETVGTLHKHGLLSESLLFDWLAVSMVWKRLEGFILGLRRQVDEPRLYENFEAMARANADYDAGLLR